MESRKERRGEKRETKIEMRYKKRRGEDEEREAIETGEEIKRVERQKGRGKGNEI